MRRTVAIRAVIPWRAGESRGRSSGCRRHTAESRPMAEHRACGIARQMPGARERGTAVPPTEKESLWRMRGSRIAPEALGLVPMELRPGDRSQQLGDGCAGNREYAHAKSENQVRQQADALAGIVQAHRRGDLKECGKVPSGGVGGEGQQRDQTVERGYTFVESCQSQHPSDQSDRCHGVDAQKKSAIYSLAPGCAMSAEQQAETVRCQRLIVALRPAHNLLDAHRPRFRDFLVALGAILVHRLPAIEKKTVGKVGILSKSVVVPASDFTQRTAPYSRDGAAVLRHEVQVHARLLVHLVTAGTLKIEQSCQQIGPDIQWHDASHDAADLRIEERRDKLADQSATGNVVGIEDEDNLGVDELHRVLERGGFAGLSAGAMERADAAGMLLDISVNDFARAVRGAVVYRDDQHFVLGIIDAH